VETKIAFFSSHVSDQKLGFDVLKMTDDVVANTEQFVHCIHCMKVGSIAYGGVLDVHFGDFNTQSYQQEPQTK